MNVLPHGMKDTEFEIYRGDTLTNEWDILCGLNTMKRRGKFLIASARLHGVFALEYPFQSHSSAWGRSWGLAGPMPWPALRQ